jgi:hypothetical protein
MPTSVDNILTKGPAIAGQVVTILSNFFSDTAKRGTLRLAVLGVIDLQGDDPTWLAATQDFNRLFKDKLPTFEPLPEGRGAQKNIKRFIFRNQASDRDTLDALLSMYVIHKVELDSNLSGRPFIKIAFTIDDTLNRVWAFLRRGGTDIDSIALASDFRSLLGVMRGVFGTGHDQSIKSWLFGSDDLTHRVSHYVMYRYSTRWGGVVKSFLTIMNPEVSGFGHYYFVHVYGPNQDHANRRLTYGGVIGFDTSIYFVGGGRLASDLPTARLTRGFKAFAIPQPAFKPDHRLLTGLMLSNSESWHPLISRFAMIHVGFRMHKQQMTHNDVRIRFIKDDDETGLEADIAILCNKFDMDVSEVTAYVLDKMNNYPTVDLSTDHVRKGLLRALTIETGGEQPE